MLEYRFMRERPIQSLFQTLLATLAVALALWIVGSTINIARDGWVPIPTVDDWDRWMAYLQDHYTLKWLFEQHYDHRLVAPKLLFVIDHLLFHARGWFLLLCSFSFQALTGLMLWYLAGVAVPQTPKERWIQAAVLTSCLFSGQQWINFVMPFQVQFIMVYCAAAAALFALWKNSPVASIFLAALATCSMANGILIWPVMLLAAVWLRTPRRWVLAIAASGLLIGVAYFYNWHKTPTYTDLTTFERLRRAVIFSLTHIGSPLAPLATPYARLRDFAAVPGVILAIGLLIALVMLWRRREHFNSARATLIFYCVFIVATSASIAYGRSTGSLTEAFEWRYLTPSYILWATMLLAAWPLLRQVPRTALYGVLCAAILAGIALNQQAALNTVRWWSGIIRLGEIAIVDNVADPEPWEHLYYDHNTPRMTTVMQTVDYLKNNNLTIFTEEWTHWPGIPLNSRFSIDPSPNACQGHFDPPVAIPSPLRPGWKVTGSAAARYVILADDKGLVAGVAKTLTGTIWNGYVSGHSRPITAYVLEADDHSLCAIGTQKLPHAGAEVSFTELGAALPAVSPQIAGAWVPDGYYKGPGGPGAPPVNGAVFGSYPDANTGSIRLGPFHLDGHTEIAIPVVTGPDSHNLSLVVRDAVSKKVYAQLDPPPVRTAWWAWRPELPKGRELTVEIYAEDKGPGWGQWLALGQPHVIP